MIPALLDNNNTTTKSIIDEINNLLLKHKDSDKKAFQKLAAFYSKRNDVFWKRDTVHEWLIKNLLLCDINKIKESLSKISNIDAIIKYSDIDDYDLIEEVPRLPNDANPLDPNLNLRELQHQNIVFREVDDNVNNIEAIDEIFNELIDDMDGNVDENVLIDELERLQDIGININVDQVMQRVRVLQRNRIHDNNDAANANNANNVNNVNVNNNNNIANNNVNNINIDNNNNEEEPSIMLIKKNLDFQMNIFILFFISLLPWYNVVS